MVKKSTVIFTILAMLAFGACTCWGYTVSQWPVPGIANTVFCPGPPCLVTPEDCTLRGPVAPSCECPLIPGAIHAAVSIPYRAVALVASPLFAGQFCPSEGCCSVDLGAPAYVTAAVPCTPVNIYVPPKCW